MAENIIAIGATSTICKHLLAEYVKEKDNVILLGRSETELKKIAHELRSKNGANAVSIRIFDSNGLSDHQQLISQIFQSFGHIDTCIVATGSLGDQMEARSSNDRQFKIINSNFVGIISILSGIANHMEERRKGAIVVLSSVAGDRGRQSNYVYGSAKSGMNAYLSGLRNRLHSASICVLTVKLGFTNTRMIEDLPKSKLAVSPDYAAKQIAKAIRARRDVIYVPFFWRYIMLLIKSLPESLFKRTKL